MDRTLVGLPVIAAALNGAEAELAKAGAHVQLAHVPDLDFPPQALFAERLDGVILTGAMQGDTIHARESRLLDKLRACPTVWVVGKPKGCWGDAVIANDYQVGEFAAEYLADRGHRRAAFVNPKPDHLLFMRREDGFYAGARRRGLDAASFCEAPPGGWTLPLRPPLEVETVQTLVDRVLDSDPRPTAIFAAADSVATLVYRALAVRELRVGRDMSVISGNNDHALIAGLHPHLTTFDIHAEEIGRLAVRHLAARMSDATIRPDCELMLDAALVPGESVARLKGGRR
jgi:DNA-binding LacI/PurR family transcriptional regulator